MSTIYQTKAEGLAVKQEILNQVVSGIKGVATQTNAPTAYTPETYPNGLFERYVVSEPITAPNSWGDIAVSQNELDANFVFLNVKNGVVSKEVSKKVETTAYLVNSENAMIRNAFKGMELSGLWKGAGLWIQTVAYTSFDDKLTLAIKDKENKLIFAPVNVDVSAGLTRIPLNSAFINGAIYVDFSKGYTFQEVVDFPINEGFIVDLNSTFIEDGKYQPYFQIADSEDIELSNKILVVDNTVVDDAGYSVTAPIAVSDGMQIAYMGSNSSNPQYFDVAHIYDEFGAVVQKINQSGTTGNFQFEVTADDASYMRVVVENNSISNFKLILKNSAKKTSLPSYETIPAPLIAGKAVAFDGTIFNAGYNVTDFVKVNPNSIIGYNGFLTLVYSVALYDANKRFIKSVLRPTGTEPNVWEGQFTTTRETMYIRASVANNRFFRLFYITKDVSNIFPTVMQGYKNGTDFKLENGIGFQKIKPALDTWEDAIEMNGTKRISNNFAITNRNHFALQNVASKEIRAITKKSPIYGVTVSGDTHTISLSEDSGLTYIDLFTITDSKIGEVLVHAVQNVNGVLFIRARMKVDSVSYAEEIILRCEKVNGIWDINEVLKVPYTNSSSYVTFEFNWGFSYHKNIVVVNDYGSQGVAGRIWISQDFGKTFTKILDIYQPPHSTYMANGHIHGSAYDPIFNRIWVSTGDGYTNTYVLWSDDLGTTWNRTQVGFKDENGDSHSHTQFVGIMAFSDFVLFNHDSPRSGVYRYNRGKKEDVPIIEWVADITDHSKNEIALPTQYSGVGMAYDDGIYYVSSGWHDAGVAATGVLGKILVSKDGYNWDVFYQDSVDARTGFGFLGSQSVLLVNDKNVMFRTKVDGSEWMILDKPKFI